MYSLCNLDKIFYAKGVSGWKKVDLLAGAGNGKWSMYFYNMNPRLYAQCLLAEAMP